MGRSRSDLSGGSTNLTTMNKVFLIFFGVVFLICLSVGAEGEESSSLAQHTFNVRTARDAQARKGAKKGAKKGARKGAKKGARKGKRKASKRGSKKRKSSQRRRKSKRKGKKSRRKGRKNGRKGRKSRGRKNGLKSTRKNARNSTVATTTNSTGDCLITVMKYMKQMSDIVKNFDRQNKRAEKHIQLMAKKNNKTSNFTVSGKLLVASGGGNLSKLSCNGKTNSSAAKTLTTLAKTLMDCPKTVNASCGKQTYKALNSTLVNTCKKLTKDFATAVKKCEPDTSNKCTCWNDSKLKSMSKELSSCKSISGPTQKITCIGAFSKCKVTEDKAVAGLAACLTSTSALVTKAKTLKANENAAEAALAKVKSLSGTSSGKKRAVATTCALVITKSNLLIKKITASPSDSSIKTVSVEISSASTSIKCSTTEKAELKVAATSMDTAVKKITSALAVLMKELQALTGSTPSAASLAGTTAKPTATKATGRRDRRHLFKNFN